MPDDDMADVRAAFARLNEDDVVPGPVGQTLADRLTERVTEAPSVLEEAVPPPQSAAVPGPAGVPAAPVAGVPAPVAPVGGTPSSQPTVLPAPDPAASTPPAEPRPPDTSAGPPPETPPGTPPSAGTPAPADPDDSAAEPAPETSGEAPPDTPGEPTDTPGEPASDTPGEPVDESPAEPEAGTDPDSPSPEDPSGAPVAESDTDSPEKPEDDVPTEPAPEDSESSQEPVQSATTAAPVSKPDGWQVDSYELRAFTDAVMRARSYLDAVQAKADRMQGAEMTPQLGTSPVGKQLAKKFDDRLNSTDGLRAMLAEAMKRMEDFVTSAEKAARSYEELEESAVANLQSAKQG